MQAHRVRTTAAPSSRPSDSSPPDEPSSAILEVRAAARKARHLANATATVVIAIGLVINHGLWSFWITLGIVSRATALIKAFDQERMSSRKRHLESHLLSLATIHGIGTSRRQMLEEFGISSATETD